MGEARVFCALDTDDLDRAVSLAGTLAGEVGGVKIGLELFASHGVEGYRAVAACGLPVFLDIKLHDIPNTVAGAVRSAARLGCDMLTVHLSGGPEMLRAAVEAAKGSGARPPRIIGVTVLTSLDDEDLRRVGQRGPVADQVQRLAELAVDCGLDGVVAAPTEVAALRAGFGDRLRLVVPGSRPSWAAADDQKRILTPREAAEAGADDLVIGRPITRAADVREAARRITAELA